MMLMKEPYNWHRRAKSKLTFGQRAADKLRNGMGSWTFVILFVVFMCAWAFFNTRFIRFDPFPFILLNLFLSMLAGLQGAILLIAAKRQDAISGAMAEHDYHTNLRAEREIEHLKEVNEMQMQLLLELKKEVSALRKQSSAQA